MVSIDGLLPNGSPALGSSEGIGNSTNDLMSGSLLTDASLGQSSNLAMLSKTLKTSSSGGEVSSAELADLDTSVAPVPQAESSLDLGQNLQSLTATPTSRKTTLAEESGADPFSGQALNALAADDSVENLQTSSAINYLSDLNWVSATSGWGPVEKDTSNGEKQAEDGQKITLNGKSYNKGLGTHSASEIRYALGGKYKTFRSDIGIDDEVGEKGSVTFQVWADGSKLYDSGVMQGDSATKNVDVDVSGKQELKLIVTDGGNNNNFDHADWANARLVKSEALSSEPISIPASESGTGTGLKAEYYDNKDLTNLKLTRTDAAVDFKWDQGSPDKSIESDTFSARWTGQVQPLYSEKYTFHTTSDDGVRLWVNGKKLINDWADHSTVENKGAIALVAGKKYDIKLEYYENKGRAVNKLLWSSPSQQKQIIPQSQLYSGDTGEEADPKTPTPSSPSGSGKQARSADSFVDSIGIATHIQYFDTPYGNYEGIIKPRLKELGVRHIRTGGSSQKVIDRLNDLAESGIKTNLVADPRGGITPSNIVSLLKRRPDAIESVEGPNEWDIHPELKYKGKSFPEGLRKYQRDLFKAINDDPATKDITVAAPSMAHSYNGLKKLGRMDSFDKGNMHSYAGGQKPTNKLDDKWIPHTQAVSGNKSIFATESGWHNYLNSSRQPGIPEVVEAKYTPRLYLEYFNNPAIERTFRYELINVGKSGNNQRTNWGLLNADGSPQPAFTALKNLIDLTEDPAAKGFTPGQLDYKLSGDLENVNQTLLQKSNGDFKLILWQDALSWDTKFKKKIPVADNKVTLSLNTPIKSAKTYLPLNSIKAMGSYTNPTSIKLSVPDHPLVVQLT